MEINDDVPTFVSKRKVSRRSARSRRTAATRGRSVTVRKGDSLGAIAKRNGTTVAKLKKLNGIKGNSIQAGKKLRVK